MTLSARAKRLYAILQHGPICSQELLLYRREFGNYPPRGACELETWLTRHPVEGVLIKSRDCIAHKSCVRYRLLLPRQQALPVFQPQH